MSKCTKGIVKLSLSPTLLWTGGLGKRSGWSEMEAEGGDWDASPLGTGVVGGSLGYNHA